MSVFEDFRLNRRSDGDDEESASGPNGQARRLMRCLTVGCERPALDADAFCAVCAGRRLAFMVFGDGDLEGWPTRAVQEPLTNPTMPALPAYPPLPASPKSPNLNAAGDPQLAPSAWEAPGATDEAASCRWCVWEMSEWQRDPLVAQWGVLHQGPWRTCQTHALRWPQFQRMLHSS